MSAFDPKRTSDGVVVFSVLEARQGEGYGHVFTARLMAMGIRDHFHLRGVL
jgi:hypothetical protein